MATPGTFGFSFSGGKSSGGLAGFPDTNALYRPKPRRTTTATANKSGGIGGFVGGLVDNLVGDVKDAALGLPMGLVNAFAHPVETAKEVAGSEWHTWSPLFEGHLEKFAKGVYDHPLGPLLDIATVLTGGAAAVGKAAEIGVAAGRIGEGSRLAKMASGEREILYNKYKLNPDTQKMERDLGSPEYVKMTSSNPLTRSFQLKKNDLYNTLAGELPRWKFNTETPFIGANTRYKKREMKATWAKHAAMTTQMADVLYAAKTLEDLGPAGNTARQNVVNVLQTNMRRHAEQIDGGAAVTSPYTYLKDDIHNQYLDPSKKMTHERLMGLLNRESEAGKKGQIGSMFTTTDVTKAARSADGKLLVVPKHTREMLGLLAKEGSTAMTTLKYFYHKPTVVWKYAVLAARPAFLANNAVGNYLMYTLSHGGSGAMRGYVDALRQVHGDFRVAKDLSRTERWYKNMTDPTGHGWINRHFLDQLTNSFADASYGLEGKIAASRLKDSKLQYGLYPITHAVADRFLRRAAINTLMRKSKEVKDLMRQGYSYDEAANRALLENPNLRNRISEKVNDTMGDYHTLNKGERVLRDIIPFYTWDRAIVRHGASLLRDRPGEVAILARLGQQGAADTEAALGNLPSFMRGVIPLGGTNRDVLGVPGAKGRVPLITTTGLNPYATLSDIANVPSTLLGRPSPNPGELLSNVNPLVTGVLSTFTKQNVVSGAPVPAHGLGPYGDALLENIRGLPQVRLAKQSLPEQGFGWDQIRKLIGEKEQAQYTRKGSTKKTDALYSKSWEEILSAYLGLPIKQASLGAAKKRAGDEAKRKLTF